MADADILRYIDTIARERELDRETLLVDIETVVAQALAKKYGLEDLEMRLDRSSGAWLSNYEIDLEQEGRILAQAVKQAMIGRVREHERDNLYEEYEQRIGEIVNGSIQRFEGDTVIVNLGRNMEGILPRSERVRSESMNIGDRIRALVLEVKKVGSRLKVILTRAHRDLVRALFELEVPEIADGIITIRRIEREPGYRTKIAVHSSDQKVDCVGACVGVRGTRIKSIIDELHGERIDIIRWNEDAEGLITNALKPAEISHIELDPSTKKALVLVDEDQLSLAIGRKGQNVRLASRLTGWEIDIMTRAELEQSLAEPTMVEIMVDEEGNPVLNDDGNPMDVEGNPLDPAVLESAREVEAPAEAGDATGHGPEDGAAVTMPSEETPAAPSQPTPEDAAAESPVGAEPSEEPSSDSESEADRTTSG
jgi:N utilization substance protein A